MFLKRAISALIFAIIVILSIQKGGIWGLLAIVGIVVILGTIEFSKFIPSEGSKYRNLITVPINCLILISPLIPEFININLLLFLAILLLFIYEITNRKPEPALLNISASVLCIFYIGWLFGHHIILLRQLDNGVQLIYLLIAVTWSGDTGAYLIGKRFGKHKVVPSISPGKTLEGYIAGLIFGIIASLAICHFFDLGINLYHAFILGILLTIVGQIGDLAESLMKRSAKLKDSGKIMPGHGGILDRCDSIIFITPALYYYLVYILKLTGERM